MAAEGTVAALSPAATMAVRAEGYVEGPVKALSLIHI